LSAADDRVVRLCRQSRRGG